MCGYTRGHGFGHTWQHREPGHDTAEPAQLAGVQLQATFDQYDSERGFSTKHQTVAAVVFFYVTVEREDLSLQTL